MAKLKKNDVIDLLKSIGDTLDRETTIYLIGGCAMSLKNLKLITIDIDAVLLTTLSYKSLKKSLLRLGYEIGRKNQYAETVYKNAYVLFKKDESKIDIFITRICNLFDFSTEMMDRARLFGRYNKLNVRLASNEDIFLFKSITGREKDVDDLVILSRNITDWNVIINEVKNQKIGRLLVEDMLETIQKLKTLNVLIPINSKLLELKKR